MRLPLYSSTHLFINLIKVLLITFAVNLLANIAFADSLYDKIYAEYPRDIYLVGIGEISKTNNIFKDKRVAEVMARVEIARQIKVRVKEETIDLSCEGSTGKIFGSSLECKNEFVMIIEQSVDEMLVGSRIVSCGEKDGIVYAVAVLPRGKTSENLQRNILNSINRIKESIEKAKEGDNESIKEVKKEYMKAVAYDKEKEFIESDKSRSSEIFEDLEKEIMKLKGCEG